MGWAGLGWAGLGSRADLWAALGWLGRAGAGLGFVMCWRHHQGDHQGLGQTFGLRWAGWAGLAGPGRDRMGWIELG